METQATGRRFQAFTLVELLVVVAIIVVLLALLLPAMQRAIQEAEMAVCGAGQKLLVSTGMIYSQEYRRAYPRARADRQSHSDADAAVLWLETTSSTYQPDLIGTEADPDRDIRPLYKPYMPYEAYGCPLAPGIEFDPESNDTNTSVFSNFSIFIGWQYSQYDHFSNETGNTIVDQRATWKGVYRFGDRLGFFDSWNNRVVESDVLVMDRNHSHSADNGATVYGGQTAHPDDDGLWSFFTWKNDPGLALTHTVYGYGYRGSLDVNSGHSDGSVRRTSDLAKIDGATRADERFDYAPAHADTTNVPQFKLMVPR